MEAEDRVKFEKLVNVARKLEAENKDLKSKLEIARSKVAELQEKLAKAPKLTKDQKDCGFVTRCVDAFEAKGMSEDKLGGAMKALHRLIYFQEKADSEGSGMFTIHPSVYVSFSEMNHVLDALAESKIVKKVGEYYRVERG